MARTRKFSAAARALLPLVLGLPVACTKTSRSPFDFAREWAAVEAIEDLEQQGKSAEALKTRWVGGDYTWTGIAMASLCLESTRTCSIGVFERSKMPEGSTLGFQPLVTLTPDAFAELKRSCGGKEYCVVEFRAKLADASMDPEMPIGLRFVDGALQKTRDPEPSERWFYAGSVGSKQTASNHGSTGGSMLRTGEPTPFDASQLIRKTF